MHPRLWQAIDRIGIRPTARFEWKLNSLLEWADLEPYLTVCPGRAASVPDPDDPLETLVAWDKRDGTALLESPHIPAHRDPILVSDQELRLYRANVSILARELAVSFNFTAQPVSGLGPIYSIGIIQTKAHPQSSVLLLVPDNPFTSVAALRVAANQCDRTILLLPSARWLCSLPSLSDSVQVKTIFEFLSNNDTDYLITLIARTTSRRPSPEVAEALHVRNGDRWEDVKMTLNPSSGSLKISIERRHIEISVWDPKRRSQRRQVAATRFAIILGRLAVASPQVWVLSQLPPSEQGTMRKAFQLLKKRLAKWVPIADGDPFDYDPKTHLHRPRFSIELKQSS